MISCTLRIKYKPILSFLVATFLTFSVFAQGEQADVAKEGVTAGAPAAQAAGGDPALISAGDALFKNNCIRSRRSVRTCPTIKATSAKSCGTGGI